MKFTEGCDGESDSDFSDDETNLDNPMFDDGTIVL